MPDLADLFPAFASHWIDTSVGRMFVRTGGEGPPLLLIHGYAQTNVMWHRVAPALAKKFALILPDLPGYGWSVAPQSGEGHAPYDKRSMAKVMVEIMETLGHVRFYEDCVVSCARAVTFSVFMVALTCVVHEAAAR